MPRACVFVVYVKGDRMRAETYVPERPGRLTHAESLDYHKVLWDQLPAENVDALKQWVAARKPTKVAFHKAGSAATLKLADQGDLETSRRSVSRAVPPYTWCLPIRLRNTRALEPTDGEWGRLVGFESYKGVTYAQWYFNPGRNYVCEFHEWGWDKEREITEPGLQVVGPPHRTASTLKLEEYARTARGIWYPRRQTQVDFRTGYGNVTYDVVTHVDDSRTVPEAILDPDSVQPEALSPDLSAR